EHVDPIPGSAPAPIARIAPVHVPQDRRPMFRDHALAELPDEAGGLAVVLRESELLEPRPGEGDAQAPLERKLAGAPALLLADRPGDGAPPALLERNPAGAPALPLAHRARVADPADHPREPPPRGGRLGPLEQRVHRRRSRAVGLDPQALDVAELDRLHPPAPSPGQWVRERSSSSSAASSNGRSK